MGLLLFIFYFCIHFFINSNLFDYVYLLFNLRWLNFFFLNELTYLVLFNLFRLDFLNFCLLFSHLLFFIWKFLFYQHLSILQVILRNDLFCPLNWNVIWTICLYLSSYCPHCVVFRILNEMVHNYTLIIISPMLNFVLCDFSQPKIVFLGKGIKYVDSCIRSAHLLNNRTISSIS